MRVYLNAIRHICPNRAGIIAPPHGCIFRLRNQIDVEAQPHAICHHGHDSSANSRLHFNHQVPSASHVEPTKVLSQVLRVTLYTIDLATAQLPVTVSRRSSGAAATAENDINCGNRRRLRLVLRPQPLVSLKQQYFNSSSF